MQTANRTKDKSVHLKSTAKCVAQLPEKSGERQSETTGIHEELSRYTQRLINQTDKVKF